MAHAGNRKKVLHVMSSLGMGGAEKLLCDIVRAGISAGRYDYEAMIINDLKNETLLAKLRASGAVVHLINRPPGSRSLFHILKTIQLIAKIRPNIVHCHGFHALVWGKISTLFVARPLFAWTIHDTRTLKHLGRLKRALTSAIADRVIAISKSVEKECLIYKIKHADIVYNGINISAYRQSNCYTENNYLSIICVGRLSIETKGHDILIDALWICRNAGINFSLKFVGSEALEEPGVLEKLRKMVSNYDLEEQISFLGVRNDVPDLLAQSDLFVLPSRYEGFGLVLIEAMAAGLPVIASDVDGPREVLADGKYGMMFRSGEAASLAEALSRLHREPELRKSLVRLSLSRADDFSIEKTVEGYEAAYTSRNGHI